MTPDIEKYSPYIKAVFDNPYSDRERIPYSIADVSEKNINRPAGIFLELIQTIRGDFSLSDVSKILSYDVIANNFGIQNTSIPKLISLLINSGAYWAHDKEHLLRDDLDIDDKFTWEKALRRVAIGLAEGNTRSIYNDATAPEVPFSLAEEIGGLMKFVKLSGQFAKALEAEDTPAVWCALMHQMAEDYMGSATEHSDDVLYLTKCIAELAEEAESELNLSFDPIFERLTEKLSETRGAKGFMSGRLTFCAMLPMRSIPFKVIGIIGLNENSFPRQKNTLEFDLIAKHPKKGDRNNRDSDRYLFLETLISAKEKIILSYIGQGERDNKDIPPSTLVSDLLAHLSDRFGINDITQKQKLYSFSKDYFADKNLYTYSKNRHETALQMHKHKSKQIFGDSDLDIDPITEVALSDFEHFFICPPDYFIKRIIQIRPDIYEDTIATTEPLTLDTLSKFTLEETAVRELLEGGGPEATLDYLMETAQLPPQALGKYHSNDTATVSKKIAQKAIEYLGDSPSKIKIDITIDDLRITGEIAGINEHKHIYIKPSTIKPKDLIRCWIRHLLLNNTNTTNSRIIGSNGKIDITPEGAENLKELVAVFKEGQTRPLRFHATDGIRKHKITGIKEDQFQNAESSYAYNLCFADSKIDNELSDKIIQPIVDHLEGK
jgi:exodeoxyribonuclease V gamma subunit